MQRALAALITLLGIIYVLISLWGMLHRGDDGIVTEQAATKIESGRLIIAVRPNSSAALAGIVPGDIVDWQRTPMATLFSGRVTGTELPYVIDHAGRSRTVVLRETAQPIDLWSPVKRPISIILLIIACTLLMLRPQRATWAFLAFAWLQTIALNNQYWPYPFFVLHDWLNTSTAPLMPVALLFFSVTFLAHEHRSWHRGLILACFSGAVALSAAHTVSLYLVLNRLPGLQLAAWDLAWDFAISALTLAVLIEAYFTGRSAHKQRIAWVVSAIAYAIALQLVVPQLIPLDAYHAEAYLPSAIAYPLWVLSPVFLGLGLLYAMTQYRVIDVRFAVSRAIVYAAITAILVAIFAVVEWAAGRIFEGSTAAAYSGIAVAVLLGFTLNALHKRVDTLIDAIFFRKEHLAEKHLHHVAESMLYADAEQPIAVFLVNEPVRALDLASAALFCTSGHDGSLTRISSTGWSAKELHHIDRTDELIPQLRATRAPLSITRLGWRTAELPGGIEAPLLAIPIKARGDLFGVVFYGAHTNGATINSAERQMLAGLSQNAGWAFDHIEAARTRAEMQRLSLELELVSKRSAPV